MSEKKSNLTDFFKKENKKKPAAKPKQAVAQEQTQAPQTDNSQEQTKVKSKNDYESSEEEKTDLLIGDDKAGMIKDKKEIQAQKRKQQQEQESGADGWKALDKQEDKSAFTSSNTAPTRGLLGAQPKGASTGGSKEISFGKGPPKFNKQAKNEKIKLDEEFPEIGGEVKKPTKAQTQASEVSKAGSSNIGMFGSSGAQEREARPAIEEKKEATKPVFTSSKKKVLVGGDQVDNIQQSKQNYDFSSLRTSAATDKVSKQEGHDGQPRQKREYGDRPQQRQFDDDFDEDFQTVTEKKKREVRPQATGGSSFADFQK